MSKRAKFTDALVLGTVNAPYRREINARDLSRCLRREELSEWLVHIATFFTDVDPSLVLQFAELHDIPVTDLRRVYSDVKRKTGERSPRLEATFDAMANAA